MTVIVHFYSKSKEKGFDHSKLSFSLVCSTESSEKSGAGARVARVVDILCCHIPKSVRAKKERKKERMFHFCYLFQLSYTSAERKNERPFSFSSSLKM